ncbi:unnamed protein product [Mytilus edulis]|uniref:Reverse transcriptase domain-containing protein n=1 Tax=Mytilus edulis TaxID=6550 RepID=A0A8S3S7W5_MYTED|nr:unnamed protein product [Mytilus edulis]
MEDVLLDISVTVDDVLKKLNNLHVDKSAGPDNLHPKVLYEVRQSISYPLSIIFNKSLSEGVLPEEWKNAILSPIFKNKGDKKQPCNYRPVSLTCVICKVCESLIRDKLMKHLLENNLLSDCQYGFRPGRSCSIQLLEVLDHWSSLLDNFCSVDTIYLDFSRAFDTVPHERLIGKLYNLGIQGKVLDWIKCFLQIDPSELDLIIHTLLELK